MGTTEHSRRPPRKQAAPQGYYNSRLTPVQVQPRAPQVAVPNAYKTVDTISPAVLRPTSHALRTRIYPQTAIRTANRRSLVAIHQQRQRQREEEQGRRSVEKGEEIARQSVSLDEIDTTEPADEHGSLVAVEEEEEEERTCLEEEEEEEEDVLEEEENRVGRQPGFRRPRQCGDSGGCTGSRGVAAANHKHGDAAAGTGQCGAGRRRSSCRRSQHAGGLGAD
ncbi:hypothetical protein DL89DRAFT_133850 [Linderina pennispora]|uniref:Uncharacterized protein n=1 Tax=Linderina pennispora TaxID=61395 RepID=A0A1Y1VUS1_9FUNG|nr:uncharacterized protein DL89DRAFT_133850 [Linderina pennispora]ORX65048.1 hypothetical protein DL89DRAFT_133850 [Linderina pennispora]